MAAGARSRHVCGEPEQGVGAAENSVSGCWDAVRVKADTAARMDRDNAIHGRRRATVKLEEAAAHSLLRPYCL